MEKQGKQRKQRRLCRVGDRTIRDVARDLELDEDREDLTLAEDEHVIEALAAHLGDAVEVAAVLVVAIAKDEARSGAERRRVPELLGDPRGARIGRDRDAHHLARLADALRRSGAGFRVDSANGSGPSTRPPRGAT
jgi:hypothetical protein